MLARSGVLTTQDVDTAVLIGHLTSQATESSFDFIQAITEPGELTDEQLNLRIVEGLFAHAGGVQSLLRTPFGLSDEIAEAGKTTEDGEQCDADEGVRSTQAPGEYRG